MAYNEFLADRIRLYLNQKSVIYREMKMMGGLAFMVNEKMCVGILKEDLMVRLDPEIREKVLSKKGCREMDFTGRPMKAFVFVDPDGTDMDTGLAYWIDLALEFNPRAKASKKKSK
jgi:TfoX/Sxy family transcriptional regulator of competence genes